MKRVVVLALLCSVMACSDSVSEPAAGSVVRTDERLSVADDRDQRHPTEYPAIVSRLHASMKQVSLCELSRISDAGGMYRVRGLTGFNEATTEGRRLGFTYVELELESAWSRAAPKKAVARILGGPRPTGLAEPWSVSLAVGEQVGILLTPPLPRNRNHYGLHPLGVFKARNGKGFTNGQLFGQRRVEAAELSQLFVGLLKRTTPDEPCPYDELPDALLAREEAVPEEELVPEIPRPIMVKGIEGPGEP
jgi:hypothetical protein